jgi:putative protease
MLPSVIYDSELPSVREALERAGRMGAKYALIQNIAQLDIVRDAGLIPQGDFRLNVANSASAASYEELGVDSLVLSPELTLPRMRDIGGAAAAIVYGRVPLMVTDKCVAREISDCETCKSGRATLVDRKSVSFPVLPDNAHRSIIFNSVPIYMADKQDELERAGIFSHRFIFSTETPKEVDGVIDAYKRALPPKCAARRIVK